MVFHSIAHRDKIQVAALYEKSLTVSNPSTIHAAKYANNPCNNKMPVTLLQPAFWSSTSPFHCEVNKMIMRRRRNLRSQLPR